jgi:hypothetical protein
MENDYERTIEILSCYEALGDYGQIMETLACASEEVWQEIQGNRISFSYEIQRAINSYDTPVSPFVSKNLVVKDISIKEIRERDKRRMEELFSKFDDEWLEVKKTLPPRTLSEVDTINDDAFEKLSRVRKEMGKFIPKNQAKRREELETQLSIAENEYQKTSNNVRAEDELYEQRQKDKFQQSKLR